MKTCMIPLFGLQEHENGESRFLIKSDTSDIKVTKKSKKGRVNPTPLPSRALVLNWEITVRTLPSPRARTLLHGACAYG